MLSVAKAVLLVEQSLYCMTQTEPQRTQGSQGFQLWLRLKVSVEPHRDTNWQQSWSIKTKDKIISGSQSTYKAKSSRILTILPQSFQVGSLLWANLEHKENSLNGSSNQTSSNFLKSYNWQSLGIYKMVKKESFWCYSVSLEKRYSVKKGVVWSFICFR